MNISINSYTLRKYKIFKKKTPTKFREIDSFHFTSFLVWTSLIFLAYMVKRLHFVYLILTDCVYIFIERWKNPHLLNDSSKRDMKSFSSMRLSMNIASVLFPNLKAKNSKMLPRMDSIGKKHALKKYHQFALNTSYFWYWIKYYSSCATAKIS